MTVRIVDLRSLDALRAEAARLGLASPDRGLSGRPLGEVPLVLDVRGCPIERITGFLNHHATSGASVRTLQTYAQRLDRLVHLLQLAGEDPSLTGLTAEQVYRLRCEVIGDGPFSGQTQSGTWNLSVSVLKSYLKWEQELGGEFFGTTDSRTVHDPRKLERLRYIIGSTRVKRSRKRKARPLSAKTIARLAAELQEPFALMHFWQLNTGLRAFELCSIRMEQFALMEKQWASGSEVAVIPVVRKGQRPLDTCFPNCLRARSENYIELLRAGWIRRAKGASSIGELFIGKHGRPVHALSYVKAIAHAAKKLNRRERSHSLRATFGHSVHAAAVKLQQQGVPVQPLLVTKDLMGHSRIDTSVEYLKDAEEAADINSRVFAQREHAE